MSETQTVADDAEDQSKSGSEDGGAQDLDATLDELASEFEEATTPNREQTSQDQQVDMTEVSGLVAELRAERQERAQERMESDIANAVKAIKGEGDDAIPLDEETISDVLWGRAGKDARLRQVFEKRTENPKAWNRAISGLRKELSGRVSVDRDVTSDLEAATAAARSASTKPPEDKPLTGQDLVKMSDAEAAALKESLG